jgi:hypothetical protein
MRFLPGSQADVEQPGEPVAAGEEPQPEVLEKPEKALASYIKGMIPTSGEEVERAAGIPTDWTDPAQVGGFMFPPLRPGLEIPQQIASRAQQIQAAEQTPAWSQERWNAGIGTAADLVGLAGILHGSLARGETPISDTIKAMREAPAQPAPVPPQVVPPAQSEIITPELGDPFHPPPIPAQDVPYAGGPQAPAPPAAEAPAASPEIGVAARYREEQQPGSVTPGTVETPAYWRQKGRDYINSGGDPRMPIRAAQAGHVSPRNVGIVSAEYERLGETTNAAAQAVQANPSDPRAAAALDAASQAQASWSNEMQPVFTRAGETLASTQGRFPIDESTFAGLYDKALEMNGGRDIPRPQKAELVRRTAKVERAKTAERQTYAKLERAVPGRSPTDAEMQARVADMVKQLTPC